MSCKRVVDALSRAVRISAVVFVACVIAACSPNNASEGMGPTRRALAARLRAIPPTIAIAAPGAPSPVQQRAPRRRVRLGPSPHVGSFGAHVHVTHVSACIDCECAPVSPRQLAFVARSAHAGPIRTLPRPPPFITTVKLPIAGTPVFAPVDSRAALDERHGRRPAASCAPFSPVATPDASRVRERGHLARPFLRDRAIAYSRSLTAGTVGAFVALARPDLERDPTLRTDVVRADDRIIASTLSRSTPGQEAPDAPSVSATYHPARTADLRAGR